MPQVLMQRGAILGNACVLLGNRVNHLVELWKVHDAV